MKLVLDVENTVTHRDGKMHLDPFEPTNSLTMVGMLNDQGVERIVTFDHSEVDADDFGHTVVQEWLDKTTVLICHNAAYDLLWLWESGFKYDGAVFDTMLVEYVLQRGQKEPLSLEACAERYELDTKKQDTLKEYFKKGYSTRDIPLDELTEYLSADLHATQQLADKLWHRLNTKADAGLLSTVRLTNRLAKCLAKVYQTGFSVDMDKLEEVREEFEQEKQQLITDLQSHVHTVMGDTPINLNSPEQLSWVIYGRKVIDKQDWATLIDPYMNDVEFRQLVATRTQRLYRTNAVQCGDCYGSGYIRKTKKNGEPFAKPSKCLSCGTAGFQFIPTDKQAGFKFKPPSAKWASANGFSTSKQNLELLEAGAKSRGMDDAVEFLSKVRRLSAVDTYLSSLWMASRTTPNKMVSCTLAYFNIVPRQVVCRVLILTCRTCHVAARFLLRKYSCHDSMVVRYLRLTLRS